MSAGEPEPPKIRVLSLSETTDSARPQYSAGSAVSNLTPTFSEITFPPVRQAISSSMASRRSPKPGALTAKTLKVPRSLLTTRVVRASPSISSAMMTKFLVSLTSFSKKGKMS